MDVSPIREITPPIEIVLQNDVVLQTDELIDEIRESGYFLDTQIVDIEDWAQEFRECFNDYAADGEVIASHLCYLLCEYIHPTMQLNCQNLAVIENLRSLEEKLKGLVSSLIPNDKPLDEFILEVQEMIREERTGILTSPSDNLNRQLVERILWEFAEAEENVKEKMLDVSRFQPFELDALRSEVIELREAVSGVFTEMLHRNLITPELSQMFVTRQIAVESLINHVEKVIGCLNLSQ